MAQPGEVGPGPKTRLSGSRHWHAAPQRARRGATNTSYPATKLVFLTVNIVPEVVAEAFRRGASAYVLKHSAAEELLTAIRTMVRGESYLSPLIARETVTFLMNTSGFDVARRLRRSGCAAKIIFLTVHEGVEMVRGAFDLGASGYVYKSRMTSDSSRLLRLLRGWEFVPIATRTL